MAKAECPLLLLRNFVPCRKSLLTYHTHISYKGLRQHESTIGDLPMASQNMAIRRRNRLNIGHVSRLGTGSTKACESCLRGTVCMCRSTNISVGLGFFERNGCQQFIQTGFLPLLRFHSDSLSEGIHILRSESQV